MTGLAVAAGFFGFYGGACVLGCAFGEMTTTNNRKLVNWLLAAGFGLEAIPLALLTYTLT